MSEEDLNRERARVLQMDRIQAIEHPTNSSFISVLSSEDLRNGFHCYPFLLPLGAKEKFLSQVGWDMRDDNFQPHVEKVEWNENGQWQQKISYLTRGNDEGSEALVRRRYYWKNYPAEIEIAEEFRLFWNLFHFHSKDRNFFLHRDAYGTEHEVIRIIGSRVEIQLRFLADFLRAKQMHLALQWEGNYWSEFSLEQLQLPTDKGENKGDLFHWCLNVRGEALSPYQAISRLVGKAIVPCPGPVEYNDPYEGDDTSTPAFIVGQDSAGRPITDAWDEERKGHENAFKLVFFKRTVLAKYYAEPELYEVGDGDLRCSGCWSLRMDNDHDRYVIAWLKDLGQQIPRAEREHWANHNVPPDGFPSTTFYTRNIRAWFADPEMPDLRLKQLYPQINERWAIKYGWRLWRELEASDRYVFRQVHRCLDESQTEFDQQNGLLAKLLVDSLSKGDMKKALPKVEKVPGDGSLNWLEAFLTGEGFVDVKDQITPLRTLQSLRSTGAAHTKGGNYHDALERGGLNGLSLIDASMKVFAGAASFLEWIRTTVVAGSDEDVSSPIDETSPPTA